MRVFLGIDLGSTTTKAVLLDERGEPLGRSITNSRSDYHLAAEIARERARASGLYESLVRDLERTESIQAELDAMDANARRYRAEEAAGDVTMESFVQAMERALVRIQTEFVHDAL